jgi:hypothetical protein
MTDQPCLRAVHVTVRKLQNISAPVMTRKQPDTFCLTFPIRRSRSASLLVKGTLGSVKKSV